MTPAGSVAIVAALTLSGCSADPGLRDALARVGEIGPERVEGRVRLVGNQPFARPIVVPVDGDPTTVSGPFKTEIGRLAGVDVLVTGVFESGTLPEPTLSASSYQIVSVEGDDAVVGTLASEGEAHVIRTQGGDVRLAVVPASLAAEEGALVWVVVDENDGAARYGILRRGTR